MKRLDAGLLTGVGVLAVHQAAYSASSLLGADSAVGHGHLALAWLLAGFAAVISLGVSVIRSLRSRRYEPASAAALSAWIVLGYTAMETAERVLDGGSALSLAGEAVFWFGLIATPLVALGLRSTVRSVHEIAHLIAAVLGNNRWPRLTPSPEPTQVVLVPLIVRTDSVSRRGPPARLRI